jgi:hypothetical protein
MSLGCDTVLLCESDVTFWGNMVPPYSRVDMSNKFETSVIANPSTLCHIPLDPNRHKPSSQSWLLLWIQKEEYLLWRVLNFIFHTILDNLHFVWHWYVQNTIWNGFVEEGYFGSIRTKNNNRMCHWEQRFKNGRYKKCNTVQYQIIYTFLWYRYTQNTFKNKNSVEKGYFGRIRKKNNSVCHWKQQFKNGHYKKNRNIVQNITILTLWVNI